MFNLTYIQMAVIFGIITVVFGIAIYKWRCYLAHVGEESSVNNAENKDEEKEDEAKQEVEEEVQVEEEKSCEIEELPVFTTYLIKDDKVLTSDLCTSSSYDKRDLWY